MKKFFLLLFLLLQIFSYSDEDHKTIYFTCSGKVEHQILIGGREVEKKIEEILDEYKITLFPKKFKLKYERKLINSTNRFRRVEQLLGGYEANNYPPLKFFNNKVEGSLSHYFQDNVMYSNAKIFDKEGSLTDYSETLSLITGLYIMDLVYKNKDGVVNGSIRSKCNGIDQIFNHFNPNYKKKAKKTKSKSNNFKEYWWVVILIGVVAFFVYMLTAKDLPKRKNT